MIRIAHVITGLEVGGAEMMLYKLLSAGDRGRFESRVYCLTGGGPMVARIEALGIPVAVFGARGGFSFLATLPRLARSLRAFAPDVVQTWLYHADLAGLLVRPWLADARLCWNLRCSMLGSGEYPWTTRALARLLGRLSPLPDLVMANSVAGRVAHEAVAYRPRRWELVANGFDTMIFRPDAALRAALRESLTIPAEAPVIGMVGRYHPMKDHAGFLRAARKLFDVRPQAHFVLAGRDVDEANAPLRALVTSLGLRANVHLLGERADVAAVMNGLDVFTLCSVTGEGFPNVVGEAMACALPCVVTDVGDARAVLGDAGLVVPPSDPVALASAWLELLELPDAERCRLGGAARVRVEEHYSLAAVVRRYEQLYGELAAQTSGGG